VACKPWTLRALQGLIRFYEPKSHSSDGEALQLTLSANVRRLRKQQGFSQERLALEAGVDRTLVSKIERVIANPTLEILVKLAVVLDIPVSRLLKD
jgi:DNA-binding XRE family transcriptional regulator